MIEGKFHWLRWWVFSGEMELFLRWDDNKGGKWISRLTKIEFAKGCRPKFRIEMYPTFIEMDFRNDEYVKKIPKMTVKEFEEMLDDKKSDM